MQKKELTEAQNKKLNNLGQKIGVVLMAILLIGIWFFIGFMFGQKAGARKVTAQADTLEYNNGDYSFSQTYYIPLHGNIGVIAPNYNQSALSNLLTCKTNIYLAIQEGTGYFGFTATYGESISNITHASIKSSTNPADRRIGVNMAGYGATSAFSNVSITLTAEYHDDEEYIDYSSLDEYAITSVRIYRNYYTDVASDVVNHYKEDVFYIELSWQIGEDDSIITYIVLYPSRVRYTFAGTYNIDASSNVSFYVNSNNSNNFILEMSYNNYAMGFDAGFNSGYQKAMTAGGMIQYEEGYQAGVRATVTDQNTLKGVVTTVIETPVNIFRTIFNWDLLGYNLFGLFTALFTIIFVVWLFKKVL